MTIHFASMVVIVINGFFLIQHEKSCSFRIRNMKENAGKWKREE